MNDLLNHRTNPRRRLRELLAGGQLIPAPGVYDAMSARLVEAAGFPAVYMSGFGVTASLLGRPDIGLLGMSEMVQAARRIVSAVDVPVIADADTGYGNAINVIRTVQEYEAAGVAAMHIEDQVTPKRCGHMTGKQVVPAEEMIDKVKAAVAARQDPDLVLIARSDAAAVEGIDAAIDRALRYREAGADMLFLDALASLEDIGKAATALAGEQVLFSWGEGGVTPPTTADQLRGWGFQVVIFPVACLLASVSAMQLMLTRINGDGTPAGAMAGVPNLAEFFRIIGLDEVNELGKRFGRG
jgi:2-methylisocitrate lyase-like PEP mutase family enzyme